MSSDSVPSSEKPSSHLPEQSYTYLSLIPAGTPPHSDVIGSVNSTRPLRQQTRQTTLPNTETGNVERSTTRLTMISRVLSNMRENLKPEKPLKEAPNVVQSIKAIVLGSCTHHLKISPLFIAHFFPCDYRAEPVSYIHSFIRKSQ